MCKFQIIKKLLCLYKEFKSIRESVYVNQLLDMENKPVRVHEKPHKRPPVTHAISKSVLLKFQHVGVARGNKRSPQAPFKQD